MHFKFLFKTNFENINKTKTNNGETTSLEKFKLETSELEPLIRLRK